jgi:hypothetical protein
MRNVVVHSCRHDGEFIRHLMQASDATCLELVGVFRWALGWALDFRVMERVSAIILDHSASKNAWPAQ